MPNTNGEANQKPNVSKMLAWVLVELMISQTMGISVKIANSTQHVVTSADRAAAQAVELDRDRVLVRPAPAAAARLTRLRRGLVLVEDGGGCAHQISPLRRRRNSEPTEMTTITRPRITAAAAASWSWPPAIAVL